MKLAITIVIVTVVTSLASQQEPTKEELLQTVQHIQRLAKEQQVELDEAHVNETNIAAKLVSTQGFLGTAQSSLVALQGKIEVLAQHDANETADKKHILGKYHKLKGIAMGIAAGVAVLLVMRLSSFIPLVLLPYTVYLYIGAGALAATLVATLL